MLAFHIGEAEHPGQRIEDLRGWLPGASLLQANVIVDAYPGQMRDLLPAQPGHPTARIGRNADGAGIHAGPPRAQEVAELVHLSSIATISRGKGGPADTRKSRPMEKASLNGGRTDAEYRTHPIRRS